MTDDHGIPWVIRQLRLRTNLSQERLAARIGVAFPTLNRWANGHARPSPLALEKIRQCIRDLGPAGRDLLQHLSARPALSREEGGVSPHAARAATEQGE